MTTTQDWRLPRLKAKTIVDPVTGCWVWQGATHEGYGIIMVRGKIWKLHRWAYLTFVGPIPGDLVPDHTCDNPLCWNFHHLKPVTNRVNILRGTGPSALNARKTHCSQGHEYNEANTYYKVSGESTLRICRICRRAKESARLKRRAANRPTQPRRTGGETHCPQGHEYSPDNIEWSVGHRKCKTCRRDYKRRLRAAKKEDQP